MGNSQKKKRKKSLIVALLPALVIYPSNRLSPLVSFACCLAVIAELVTQDFPLSSQS